MTDHAHLTFIRMAPLKEHVSWRAFLTPAEIKKAQAMPSEIRQERFIVSRGLRRKLLSECLGCSPGDLQFIENPEAKPSLKESQGWDFNITHAGNYVAMATRCGRVGIDLEIRRPVRQMAALVRRYFHPEEAAIWSNLKPEQQEEGFFLLWSAREAALKCLGISLAKGLSITKVDPAIFHNNETHATVGDSTLFLRRLQAPADGVMLLATSERLPADTMNVKD